MACERGGHADESALARIDSAAALRHLLHPLMRDAQNHRATWLEEASNRTSLDTEWAKAHIQVVATVVSGDFEWDDTKEAANVTKHGVTFDEAAVALASDAHEVAFADPALPDRIQSIVMSPRDRVLFVVTTERGSRTRIISARKANDHEQRTYEAG